MKLRIRSHRACLSTPLRRHTHDALRGALSYFAPHVRDARVWLIEHEAAAPDASKTARIVLRLNDGAEITVGADAADIFDAVERAAECARDHLLRHLARPWMLPTGDRNPAGAPTQPRLRRPAQALAG